MIDKQQIDEQTKVLLFDTETSGFITKSLPCYHQNQGWCIQLGAILTTEEAEIDRLNLLIKPNGRTQHPKAFETHKISLEYAEENGLNEWEVIDKFGLLMRDADIIICHNYDFDWQYVYHMMERNVDKMSDEARSAFYLDLPYFCTMKDKNIGKFVGAKNKNGKAKWPKLIELYEKISSYHEELFNVPWEFANDFNSEVAHDALDDIIATSKCYFKLKEWQII